MTRSRVENCDYRRECAIKTTVGLISGKWKPMALYHLLGGTMRFSDLQRSLPDASQRMLTLQLRELETDGLIHREVYPQVPPKVEYSLTDLGRSLEPIILAMLTWGEAFLAQSGETSGDATTQQEQLLAGEAARPARSGMMRLVENTPADPQRTAQVAATRSESA